MRGIIPVIRIVLNMLKYWTSNLQKYKNTIPTSNESYKNLTTFIGKLTEQKSLITLLLSQMP
jgi:hypothetical protein